MLLLFALLCGLTPTMSVALVQQKPMDESAQDHYVSALLHKYHLSQTASPFTYQYKHEIYSPLLQVSRQVPEEIEKIAVQQHSYLQKTTYYRDLKLLAHGEKVRAYQLMTSPDKKESGTLLSAVTEDGVVIKATLLERNSSTLLVVGGGFTNFREQMAPMGDLFNSYDVLFFDYRGHGYEKTSLLKPRTWKNLSKAVLGIDRKQVRLGLSEHADVKAIVQAACHHKKYTNVVGLGICYSGLILIKTAALYPDLFTKLIIDGCWHSLRDAVETLAKDPGMIPHPQRHSRWQHNWLVRQRWFQRAIIWFGQKLFNVEFDTVSVMDYAPLLKESMPILFIHGKDDAMIPREKFETMFHATNCRQKTALITTNPHVWNHLKEKELYKEVVEMFIGMSYQQFNHFMITPEALIDYKTARLQQLAGGR